MIKLKRIGITEKEHNIVSVLESILNTEEVSVTDIIQNTQLSPSTVGRILNVLQQNNLIVHAGKSVTDCGRRPMMYSLNAEYGFFVHFELGAGKIKGFLCDVCGKILQTAEHDVKLDITTDELKHDLNDVFFTLLKKQNIERKQILAAGFSIPGVIDENVSYIQRIPNIFRFKNVNLYESVKEVLQVPVIINNDACLATLGEKVLCYPECKNMVFINFSDYYGIGGGMILNGELYGGHRKAAGEIGDMFFDTKNFEEEYTQNAGCLESNSGLQILFEKAMQIMKKGGAPILRQLLEESPQKKLNLNMIEQAVVQQDYAVTELFDRIVKIWAGAIVNIFALLDPELLVLGGEVNESNEVTLAKVKFYVSKAFYYQPALRLSSLGPKAQVYGGIEQLKNFVYNTILSKQALI